MYSLPLVVLLLFLVNGADSAIALDVAISYGIAAATGK